MSGSRTTLLSYLYGWFKSASRDFVPIAGSKSLIDKSRSNGVPSPSRVPCSKFQYEYPWVNSLLLSQKNDIQ